MNDYQNLTELFKAIINNPQIIRSLPQNLKTDIDFIETFYIILNDKIKPYISKETYNSLKHREIIFKNQHIKQINKPNISLLEEENILHNILTDISYINLLPTDEKYNSNFLEMLYIIWEDDIEAYIPYEIYEHLKNEKLMKQYHQTHHKNQVQWAKEVDQKIKLLSKR